MIISHKHRFIFFAIPKTGTHSIRFALRPLMGAEDEEHVTLFKSSKLTIPEIKDRKDGHFSVQEIRPYLTDDIWNSYFKFCFVRNPWDKFISTVFFRNKDQKELHKAPLQFLKQTAEKKQDNRGLFYRQQVSFLFDDEQNLAMDFIGKTENMQADFDTICSKLGITSTVLDQKNQSKHDNYKSYYDDELKEKVATLYKDDIRLLNYTY